MAVLAIVLLVFCGCSNRPSESVNKEEKEAYHVQSDIVPEEIYEDTFDDYYAEYKAGFYLNDSVDDTTEVLLNNLKEAMMNCGMNENQLMIAGNSGLEEAVQMFAEGGCRLVVLPGADELSWQTIVKNYPNIQFMVYGRVDDEMNNVISFSIDLTSVGDFRELLKEKLENTGEGDADVYLDYRVSYRPIFEDVITIAAEMNAILSGSYDWGIERGCIYFPAFYDDKVSENLRQLYEQTLEQWIHEQENPSGSDS